MKRVIPLFPQTQRLFTKLLRMSRYSVVETGTPFTDSYKLYFKGANGPISPFHDIPLHHENSENVYNMVVEIPRWTNAKMEISKSDLLNPIKQDIKNGKLRYVDNVFPYKGYIWNYGAFPQTWEDPSHLDSDTKCKGDNDPIDVCEIGSVIRRRGSVCQVKVLGVLGLIDEGETDWKMIAIDVNDPLASKLNEINDVETLMPGYLNASRDWFRRYKVPQGKPLNEFAFDGQFKDRKFAEDIIRATHNQWKKLVGKEAENGGICCENVSVAGSPYLIDREEAKSQLERQTPFQLPKSDDDASKQALDKWHFVSQ